MRRFLSIAIVMGLVGCHKTPQVEPRPLREVGDYGFRMTIGAIPVTGEFSIEKDTVELAAEEHSCRRLVERGLSEEPLKHSFQCGGGPTHFTVVVDSKQPTLSSWVSTGTPRARKQQVCDRYAVNKDGQQVCVATRTVIVSETPRISGRLDVRRIAAAAKP